MATSTFNASTLAQLNNLTQLSIFRQIILMLLVAGGVALGVSIVLWSRGNNYTVLYSNLASQDISEIAQALETAKLDYRIEPGSGYFSVPEDTIYETRLHLASLGLPRSSAEGYDILTEESSLGTSNFIEQARYNRALEQELVKTIKLIRGVRDVRVHISIPKQSSFLRSSNKPSASVMLDLTGTMSVSDTQIAGIGHLVASSVAGLESEDVSIVDQKGSLLSENSSDPLGSSNQQMKYTRTMEQEYTKRIIGILTPIVGPENIRAQVTADLDFTVIETTEENFNPDSVVIRSEQRLEENRGNGNTQGGGLSPTPPDADATNAANQIGSGQSRVNATRNFEIDKSVSYIRRVPGKIRRLSVAVLVDLNSAQGVINNNGNAEQQAAKVARITQLVKDSIGFNSERGDSVNIINEAFSLPEEVEQPAIIKEIWDSPWVPSALKQLAASIVVLMLIFAVFRPALKSVLRPVAPNMPSAPSLSHQPSKDIGGGGADNDDGAKQQAITNAVPQKSVFDQNLTTAQNVVQNEPARAARMIKEWVASD